MVLKSLGYTWWLGVIYGLVQWIGKRRNWLSKSDLFVESMFVVFYPNLHFKKDLKNVIEKWFMEFLNA